MKKLLFTILLSAVAVFESWAPPPLYVGTFQGDGTSESNWAGGNIFGPSTQTSGGIVVMSLPNGSGSIISNTITGAVRVMDTNMNVTSTGFEQASHGFIGINASSSNAINFCLSNNITDRFVQRKVDNFYNFILNCTNASNFVDAMLLTSEYGPTNRLSFMGTKYVGGPGSVFTMDGLGTNFSVTALALPLSTPLTNGSVFVWFNYTNAYAAIDFLGRAIVGVTDNTGASNAFWLYAAPYSGTYLGVISNSTLVTQNKGLISPPGGPGGASSDPDFIKLYYTTQEAFSFNTNGVVDEYRYANRDPMGLGGQFTVSFSPMFTNNPVAMNYVQVGKDPAVGDTTLNPSTFNEKYVLVFNCPMNTNLFNACVSACQSLEDSKNLILMVGDSRMCASDNSPQNIKGVQWYMMQWCRQNGYTYYDMSYPGQSYNTWLTVSPPGYSRIPTFLAPFINHPNVNSIKVIYALGYNDVGINRTAPTTIAQEVTNLIALTTLPGVSPWVCFPYTCATNGDYVTNVSTGWTGITTPGINISSNIAQLDQILATNLLTTNGLGISGQIRLDAYFTPSDMQSNAQIQLSADGVHFNGSNQLSGYLREAQVLEGFPPYMSPFLFPATNVPTIGNAYRWNGTNFYWAN